jgi:glycosyltransferase involved in cell wall biosynthesis
MLSHYPPMRGGIAAYADQLTESLRKEGNEVVVASPEPSEAGLVLDVRTRGAGLRLASLAREHDRLIVQFHPEMLGYQGTPRRKRATALWRLVAGMRAAPSCEVCIHEVDYGEGPLAPLLRTVARRVWKLADLITVHTERERSDFMDAFRIEWDRIRVVSQGAHLLRRVEADRTEARAALGLPAGETLLLAIGILQPNKGFDRAIRAFAKLPTGQARLYVVGSIRREDLTSSDYLAELRRLVDLTPRVELREGYLSDEDFDRWIVAADALVLPYRRGWSSNVMERGLLYHRPVIMTRVGGMAEQGADREHVTLVDDDELDDALRRVLGEVLATRQ